MNEHFGTPTPPTKIIHPNGEIETKNEDQEQKDLSFFN